MVPRPARTSTTCRSRTSRRSSTGRSSSRRGSSRDGFPAILDHPQYGAAARELYEHAQALLEAIIDEKLLTARGVYGFWPANADRRRHRRLQGRRAAGRADAASTCCGSRKSIADGRPNRSLADFVAPRDSGVPDYLGAFAVTAGIGADALVHGFEQDHDDYNAIMVKALADRLAEAFAEYLHAQARKDWGYGAGEQLSNEDLIAEKYRGIRPAFGYPACPDHTEKRDAVRAARRRPAGHHADRELRDAAGGVRQRAVLLAIRRRSTSTSAGSAAISSSRTRSGRGCRSRKPSAGSRRTCRTTRRKRRWRRAFSAALESCSGAGMRNGAKAGLEARRYRPKRPERAAFAGIHERRLDSTNQRPVQHV